MSWKKSNLFVIVLTIGLLFSCSESSTSPDTDNNNGEEETNSEETESTTGVLKTHISATGSDLDTDGYMLILNGSEEKNAATEDTVFFGDLDEGSHEIELTKIADNCSTQGDNPKSFDISADDTTDVKFTVECESLGPAPLTNAIVYTSTGESGGYSKIYVMNEDGSEPVLLHEVEGSNVLHPDISPDGTRIIFSSSGESLFDQFIYVMNSDVSEVTQLTTESDDANDFAPVWSPDGSEILFERDNDLFVMNDDGSDQTNITNTEEYLEWDPEWSPDGTEIVYRRGTDDDYDQDEGNIIIANADGSEPRLLTGTAADIDGEPAWSPDGNKIAFARRPDGGVYEVFVIDVDGSNLMQITEVGPDASEYSSREPAWSPDGNRIAFSGRRDGDEFIHLINPDGTNVVILDNGTIHQEHPDWSPLQK